MDVFEVEDVCTVLWDVLDVTFDVVDGSATVGVCFAKLLPVYHLVVRLNICI